MTPAADPPASTHLVLIPSYDAGPLLRQTVAAARACWPVVWVVSDGSTDGSDIQLGTPTLCLPRNRGKGAAVREGLVWAGSAGFTHALVMDADGQHPAERIRAFMAASMANPAALVLGVPQFGPDAPAVRVAGRRLANGLTRLMLGRGKVPDALFGFRVYPIAPLLQAMARSNGMRGFDFDPEAAIRLCRAGLPTVSLPAPVRYLSAQQGGVSHFRYWRDNWLLARMFLRLLLSP